MKKFGCILFLVVLTVGGSCFAQTVNNLTRLNFTVEQDTVWTNLFKRTSGWFGGDGIYTIPLSSGKTLFIFSDTMIGKINSGKLEPGSVMVHNSVAYLRGEEPKPNRLIFFWDKTPSGKPESLFIPKTPATKKDDYLWLGSGFLNDANNFVYIFGYRIRNTGKAVFGFAETGNLLIKFPANQKFPFKNHKQIDAPFFIEDGNESGSFGAAILANTKNAGAKNADGYIYVYGVKGSKKEVLVARVLPNQFENFQAWEYWTGKTWSKNMKEARPVADKASNELSVTQLADGRYAMIFQVNGISTKTGLRLGESPVGPFGPIIEVWDCSKDLLNKNFFAYNAKAHPSLSGKNELLISYNINSFDFLNDLKTHPQLYRPRFIKLKIQE